MPTRRNRNRNQRGGFKEAYGDGGSLKPEFAVGPLKNHKLWTAYFNKNSPADGLKIARVPAPTGGGKKFLYVIDMQNDFIDRNYTDNNGSPAFGKFAVGEGTSVIGPIIDYANAAINNAAYGAVIFSRDYHPADHCSFGAGHARGGNFPPHCVQGTKGALLVDEITAAAGGIKFENPKVKLLLKGMHPDADSFAAAPFPTSRQSSSGPGCIKCYTAEEQTTCGIVTGGWELNGLTTRQAANYNSPVTFSADGTITTTGKGVTPVKYTPVIPAGSVIEVCGLAGDYCVRDSAIALAQANRGCTVVVLNSLVRYPFVPMWLDCPMHKNEDPETAVRIDAETGTSTTGPATHKDHLDYFLSDTKDKGFNYYLFDPTGKLMKPAEITDAFPTTEALKAAIDAQAPNFGPVYNHFLSDPRDIIKDYVAAGVKIVVEPIEAMGGGRRRNRNRNNRKTQRRQKQKQQRRQTRRS